MWGPAILFKKTPTQILSSEICDIFKNNYFEEHLWTTTSKLYFKRDSTQMFSCEFCELFKNSYFVEHLLTAGSETPVWECLFNKAANLRASRPLAVLERDTRQVLLCEFCELLGKYFCRTPRNHFSYNVFFLFFLPHDIFS